MDGNAKQEVAEKLRSSSSVLVTVSNDPSVDQLASALGLSLMLSKLGKHTTTVFSGDTPNTMQFLDPEKTFDKTVDGLRDFIISLDKDKADKLRYKVEDNVVKIYITPYKSKITDKDLNFTQGDFNVDLVVALGVHKRNELDNAITSHGRILHDATIVTINSSKPGDGSLGGVDWTDENASCLSEMLVSISEALEGGILDQQMSTAFLTGIVAATERFKNDRTTPKVMTMSAQLMAAGANQQLIASNLQIKRSNHDDKKDDQKKDEPAKDDKDDNFAKEDHTMAIDQEEKEGKEKKPKEESKTKHEDRSGKEPETDPASVQDDEDNGTESLAEIESSVHARHRKLNEQGRTEKLDPEDPAIQRLEDDLSQDSSTNLIDLEDKLKSFDPNSVEQLDDPNNPIGSGKSMDGSAIDPEEKPTMGGTFNATSQEAHERLEADKNRAINKEILSHGQPSQTGHGNDLQPSGEKTVGDVPNSEDLMNDLQEARRAVEDAMSDSSGEVGAPTQALNANPMAMDDGASMDLNLSNNNMAQMNTGGPQQGLPPMQPAPQQTNFGPMNNGMGQSPMPMPPPQMPQQQFQLQQPQQPQGNPMFNLPPQGNMPTSNSPQFGNGQQPMPPNGVNGGQMPPQPQPQNGQVPPPMPPNAPPPMPPFN